MATEIESNETIATANLLTANVQMTGQASSYSDYDYFKFYTSVSGTTKFTLTLPSYSSAYYVNIYDNSGTLQKSYSTYSSATYSVAATSAGYSYIAVRSFSSDDYSITTSFNAGSSVSSSTEIESNGAIATANLLTANIQMIGQASSYSDYDYFKFYTSESGTTKFTLTLPSYSSAYYVNIYDKSGTLQKSYSTYSSATYSVAATSAGYSYIAVRSFSSDDYSITTSFHADNLVTATGAADTITNLAVSQNIDGGAGTDTLVYISNSTTVVISKSGGNTVVTNTATGEVDTLVNVERLKFADTAIAFDTSGVGGQAYRVYKAAFNRTPDVGGLGFWISGMDGGVSLNSVAQGFVNSAEFKSVYGASPTNAQIVTRFYDNVLGRAADSGGYNYWLGILDSGQSSVAQVLASFSESSENQAAVIGVIGNGVLYTPYG